MIGEAVVYAATRATEGAVESLSRRLFWWAAGGVLLVGSVAFGLLAGYWYLAPVYGPFEAAAMIAIGCLVGALATLCVPLLTSWLGRLLSRRPDLATATVEAVQEEAREAVDYLGTARVMATAFMLGLGAARRLRG